MKDKVETNEEDDMRAFLDARAMKIAKDTYYKEVLKPFIEDKDVELSNNNFHFANHITAKLAVHFKEFNDD